MSDIKRELKARDFYKIKLLKNYNRIVENILPMEVISNMPYYTLPERDRNDILRSQTQGQKARTLLNILITSHEKAYYSFLNALRADVVFKDLADEIEKTPVSDNASVEKFYDVMRESVPAIIKGRHNKEITDWRKGLDTKSFVTTDALMNLYSNILKENFVTIIGTRGCGKSSALHYVALMLYDSDFETIPCTEPEEMMKYHNPYRKQVFVVDNCTTVRDFFNWNKVANEIKNVETYISVKPKIMIAVQWGEDVLERLLIDMSQKLPILLQNVFKMLSNDNKLKENEMKEMAEKYEVKNEFMDQHFRRFSFYPELCSTYALIANTENPITEDLEFWSYHIVHSVKNRHRH